MFFLEDAPEFKNQYTEDRILRSYLNRKIPKEILSQMEPGLIQLGDRVCNEIYKLGFQAEKEQPVLVPFDSSGKRIDKIEVSTAWERLAETAVEEKLVATAYERNEGIYSRIHQMVRIYLYGASSAIYTCPLAMSDGAARAIELYAKEELNTTFKKIISTDVKNFWTSGQWMTEKTGGSDVGQSTTIAKKENGQYKLYGNKFFTSATTSNMAMTLARIEGAPEGGKGLSLFYIETRRPDGSLNHIKINKLKNKMGTKALPTAELDLEGAPAHLVGGEGNGIKKISSLFNITRIWNACIAACFMRRGLVLSKDFAKKRYAFGKYLIDQSLHAETLANIQVEQEAAFLLVMRIAELLGKEEMGQGTKEEALVLRILTPIAKLYTAKQAIAVSSEVIESFGGAGYMEDTGIPRLLSDSQVLSIWEGTTNVLSLDMLRAIQRENALAPFIQDMMSMLSNIKNMELQTLAAQVRKQVEEIVAFVKKASTESEDYLQSLAREFSMNLASAYMAALLIEQAEWSLKNEKDKHSLLIAKRWCERKIGRFEPFPPSHMDESKSILS
jgi:alkylation response protein AidB-like acyl-CoA dehydrogenase